MREYTISPADAGLRLDQWCKRSVPELSYALTQKLIRKGDLKINKRKVEQKTRLNAGDIIAIYASFDAPTSPAPHTRPAPKVRIGKKQVLETQRWVIYENNQCIVINKPAGIAVQGGSGVRDCVDTRLDAFIDAGGERPRLVHRIDRDTSGILVLGKTRESAALLTEAFRDKTARKLYWALVIGVPDQPIGTIDLPLAKRDSGGGIQKMSVVVDRAEGQHALTHYRVIASFGGRLSWLELSPVTGRTHQLRVHLNAIGHPVYGDGKYAGQGAFVAQPALEKQLHLHARYLEINDPACRMRVVAEMPPHMFNSWDTLGFNYADDGVSLLELID
jgi:23S rRNA pseudouridine955/2504/2580 synthase